MTLFPRTIPYQPSTAAPTAPLTTSTSSSTQDRFYFPLTILILLSLYLLLQNRYWVPAGDSELYTAVARSIARGQGYLFNGQPVLMIPPGWAIIMAGVMKITPYFLPLKLLAMTCMLASLACGYWIVRRFASPKQTAIAILLTGILSHVYQATYWLISEGSFCLAVSAGVLLALQIAEGKRAWWRAPAVVLLCVAAISIRWAGILSTLLVVAALLDGQLKPRFDVRWITAAVAVLLGFGTFFGLREALKPSPEQLALQKEMMMGTGEDAGTAAEEPPITGASNQTARAYRLIPQGSFADRFVNWGRWYSWLYWQPFRAAGSSKLLANIATVTGWILLGLITITTVVATLQRRWLWLATCAYCAILALGWQNVNARYYVPVAFLLTIGILLAANQLHTWFTNRNHRRVITGATLAFIASVALCNGLLYAVEMSVARSSHFAQRYETGLNMSLISAGEFLMKLPNPPKDGEIAVSGRYTNMNRPRPSPFALRVLALLTDRVVQTPRFKLTDVNPTLPGRNAKLLRNWLYTDSDKVRVKWYLYQPPINPWRVWHFRLGWYQKWQTGQTSDTDDSRWHLYKVLEEKPEKGKPVDPLNPPEVKLVEVFPPPVDKYPTRVPGL
ncbi:MAG TPA: hypothetical protein VF669_19065 [Tepidisphaeraceae bacterium]|jgi:hypothetical protein